MRRSWRPVWIEEEWVTQEFYDAQAAVYVPELPSVDDGIACLVGCFIEIGPTLPAGMSSGPITQSEIGWYQWNTGVRFTAWEARLIRAMSVAYLNESAKATKQFYPPPWWPEGEPRPMTKEEANIARQNAMDR